MPHLTPRHHTLSAPAAGVLVAMLLLCAAIDGRREQLRRRNSDGGSVTLEQVAIAAGLLAVAVGAVAVIGKAVTHYTDLLN